MLDEIAAAFPQLRCRINRVPQNVDFYAEFPEQPGLAFRVAVHLDGDVVGLHAGEAYHQDFFPISAELLKKIGAYICGLISGEYRIVEYRGQDSRAYRADLQQRTGLGWKAQSVWARLHLPRWSHHTRILHNRVEERENKET